MFQQRNAYEKLIPQNYRAMDRADMFFPPGHITAPLVIADAARPRLGPMPVHAVPVTYSHPSADTRPRGPIGIPSTLMLVSPT